MMHLIHLGSLRAIPHIQSNKILNINIQIGLNQTRWIFFFYLKNNNNTKLFLL